MDRGTLVGYGSHAEMLATENLRNPTGLALGRSGHLWVSDAESNAIVDVIINTTTKASSFRH